MGTCSTTELPERVSGLLRRAHDRPIYNHYGIAKLNSLGYEKEAKVLFWKTLEYVTVYNDRRVWELRSMWDGGEAAALFRKSKKFSEVEDIDVMEQTRRMLMDFAN